MKYIYPYKTGLRSVRELRRYSGIRSIKLQNSRFRGPFKTVVNWGSSAVPDIVLRDNWILNPPDAVSSSANKLTFMETMAWYGVVTPDWTTDLAEAERWLANGSTVMARTKLRGHSGDGIVVCTPETGLTQAPLYTKYIKSKQEWRVHVFNNNVLFTQRKVRKPDQEVVDWHVRSHSNGFMFQRHNEQEPEGLRDIAKEVVSSSGLDFGAVDIIWNQRFNQCYVLEVNTAPNLEGQSVEEYARAILEL
jgi:glutathione synthase/RimK-type ligase-like ATP-grasp enzyme